MSQNKPFLLCRAFCPSDKNCSECDRNPNDAAAVAAEPWKEGSPRTVKRCLTWVQTRKAASVPSFYIYNLPSELVGNANWSRLPTHQLPELSIVSAMSAEPLLLTCTVTADLPPKPHWGSEGVWISRMDLPNCMCPYRNSLVWWLTPPVSTLQEQRQHQELEANLDTFSDIIFKINRNLQQATSTKGNLVLFLSVVNKQRSEKCSCADVEDRGRGSEPKRLRSF